MPVESADDRAAFVNPEEFGKSVTLIRPAYGPVSVNAIVTRESGPVDGLDSEVEVEGQSITLELRKDDLSLFQQGDEIQISNGDTGDPEIFVVTSIDADGTGMARIICELPDASA